MSAPTTITTGHNKDGKSVFVENPQFKSARPSLGVVYGTLADGPVDLNGDADLNAFNGFDHGARGFLPKQGCAIFAAEWTAGNTELSHLHRTLSVDIGVVTRGQVECHLDSGEVRLLKQGDVLIQRGTAHQWRNPSETEGARVLFFVLPSKPVDGATDGTLEF